jgi:hypothetical protein
MSKSDTYLMLGVIYIAPQLHPAVGFVMGFLCILRACVEATKE